MTADNQLSFCCASSINIYTFTSSKRQNGFHKIATNQTVRNNSGSLGEGLFQWWVRFGGHTLRWGSELNPNLGSRLWGLVQASFACSLVLVLEEPVTDGGTHISRSSVYETIEEETSSPAQSLSSKKSSPTTRQPVFIVDSDTICIHPKPEKSTRDDERGRKYYYALRDHRWRWKCCGWE